MYRYLLVVCFIFVNCSGYMSSDMDTLKNKIVELEKRITVLEVELKNLMVKSDAFSYKDKKELNNVKEKPKANVRDDIQRIDKDISVDLSGSNKEVGGSSVNNRAIESENIGLRGIEERGDYQERNANALYDKGYLFYRRGELKAAIEVFEDFVSRYPKHNLVDNAYFWLGSAYCNLKQYSKAISFFDKAVELYPNGNKVPDILLKKGDCLRDMGKMDEAKYFYRKVVEKYPNSGAAFIARDRLK